MIYKILVMLFSINSFINFAHAGGSIYEAKINFKDETNTEFALKSLEGKTVLMSMAYTSCQGTCPLIVKRLKHLEKVLAEKNIKAEVVIVTYDPAFDKPAHLTEYYRESMGIKSPNWHFLVASDRETRMMSMLLGIKYSRNKENGVIIHDNKVVYLNKAGEITGRIESLEDLDSLIIGQ